MARFAGMDSSELTDFLRPSRNHMKQHIFVLDDEYASFLNSQFLVMGNEVMRVLCGHSLSTEEFFKVDKTALSEILCEEPDFSPSLKTSLLSQEKAEEDAKKENKEDGGDYDLDAIIKGVEKGEASIDSLVEKIAASTTIEKGKRKVEVYDKKAKKEKEDEDVLKPYTTDLEYLEDQFKVLESKIRIKRVEMEEDDLGSFNMRSDNRKPEAIVRELRAKLRADTARLKNRLALTYERNEWLPRIERLVQLRQLDAFEKNVLISLIGSMLSQEIRKAGQIGRDDNLLTNSFQVGTLITTFCDSLADKVRSRTYFYKNSKLVREGIIKIGDPPFRKKGDLHECTVEIDRKLLDYIVGLDTELSELIDGSDLYLPTVSFDQVILPEERKKLILDTIHNYDAYKSASKELKLEERLSYGTGVCLLFYGASGTGKTMTANAIAHHLKRKLLLVNLPAVGDASMTKETLRFISREAKIHNAILFFDECDTFFENRSHGGKADVSALLTEIEAYDGLILMATNRPYDLDEG